MYIFQASAILHAECVVHLENFDLAFLVGNVVLVNHSGLQAFSYIAVPLEETEVHSHLKYVTTSI